MTITRPTYATREDVKAAADFKLTARNNTQVDEAIEAASESIDGQVHRVFYPMDDTRYVDWPNFQYAYPWRIWLDAAELADTTVNVPVVTSGGNVIPAGDILWGNPRYSPPFTYFELSRATSASFGQGSTPQRDVAITGTFGYWLKYAPAGTLTAAVADTTSTSIAVSNSAAAGVGDSILIDAERMLVTDKAMVSTGLTQQGSGVSTKDTSDVALDLGTGGGALVFVGETLLLDSERMLVVDIAGDTATVKRAWDGTVLATHTGATIYAPRSWTVQRAALGTLAATHADSAVIKRFVVPGLVKSLAVGEALVEVRQKVGAYAGSQGTGDSKQTGIGKGLDDIRTRCTQRYGRTGRSRAV